MKEEWKQVRQHKHTLGADYWVSSHGRVKSVIRGKTRIIKAWMMGNYFGVTLGGVKSKTGKKRPDKTACACRQPKPENVYYQKLLQYALH